MKTTLKIVIPIIILAAGAAVMAALINSRPKTEKRKPEVVVRLVRVETVESRDHRYLVSSHGNVAPRTAGTLVPQVSGKIVWKSASWANGGFFQAGEPLLRFEDREYRLAESIAKGQLAQAQLRLAQEEEEAAIAKREWEKLGKKNGADGSPAEPPPLLLRKPQLDQAKAALDAAQASVDRAALDLERTTVSAPYTGRFRAILSDFGDYVRAGTVVARVYATDYVEIRLPIPDLEIPYVDLPLAFQGEAVNGDADASHGSEPEVQLFATFGGQRRGPWSGQIVRTEGEISPQSRMVHAIARVEKPYERRSPDLPPLAVGLFVEATITGREVRNVASIPRHTLRPDGTVVVVVDQKLEDSKNNESESRLRFRKVEVLRKRGDSVIVDLEESELAAGDRVCVSPLEVITDGMKVRVVTEGEDER